MEKSEKKITLISPEGLEKNYDCGVTSAEFINDLEMSEQNKIVAVKINGALFDLSSPIYKDAQVEFIFLDSPEGLEIYRHTTSHIMAQAVNDIFKNVSLAIGPVIQDGFYYDFDIPDHTFVPEDLERIEKRMQEIIDDNKPLIRKILSKKDAIKLFTENNQPYKIELINEFENDTVSIYEQGDFIDLCRGPHLPSTGWIKAFKLLSTAGAYWRGSEKNKMLQRIYGTSFLDRKTLRTHLAAIEEAKKRDHRKLGKELGLFSIEEEVGPGLILWHPKGALVRNIIEDFWKKEHYKNNYDLLYTPHIARSDLWKTSGHWEFYRENLFSPMEVEDKEYLIKPMNCPFHIHIYKSHLRSYRELPIKYAELGTVYRYERSGVLHGLLRVRGFTQDDAHIFCRPDQIENEIKEVLDLTLFILRSFGFERFDVYLSTRPEKYVGTLEDWETATNALANALEASDFGYEEDPGEGVFYGPKIDIKIRDSLGRAWQCSTIQVDFNLPQRFEVTYIDSDNNHKPAIMIHRALMGSLERFFGCLVEHYGGAFPMWLAPVQIKVLAISDKTHDYAAKVAKRLREEGFRVDIDLRNEKLGFKIREAQTEKIPYMLILGEKERDSESLAIRSRDKGRMDNMDIEKFISMVKNGL